MRKKLVFLFFATLAFSGLQAQQKAEKDNIQKRYFEINKNIEVFNSVIKELDMFYVDTLDVQKTIRSGITSMLGELDPYTTYLTEEETTDFTSRTKGEYAGVGALIVGRNINGRNLVQVSEIYDGMPAQKGGLKDGDIILSIDDIDMTTVEPKPDQSYLEALSNKVSSNLKGQVGTNINIKVERPGEKKPLKYKITRENIHVPSVPYYGILENNTGYIILTGFTENSAKDVKSALLDLKKQGITSLVLDLRNNPGGLLDEAVQIVNFFVPKGEVVLKTQGKMKQWDRTYRTTLEPIDAEIPLVVLVNKGSASAAEIVSGALQDMDRAVVMGERTYGKGLVQATRDLPYGSTLKITSSKYYIPSGRCIQAIDYTHKNKNNGVTAIPDSLTSVFKTKIGREVRDGGGVIPDVQIEAEKTPSMTYYLENQHIIFDWVSDWVSKHPKVGSVETLGITDEEYDNFKDFVKSKKDFKYDMLSEKRIKLLKEVMDFEGYSKTAGDEYKALEAKLVPNLDRDLDNFKDPIEKMINEEIAKRYYHQKGVQVEKLKKDSQVKQAIELVNSPDKINEIFTPGRQIIDTTSKTGSEEEEDFE